jgi:hypothetical protein
MNIYENRACIVVRCPDVLLKTDRDSQPVMTPAEMMSSNFGAKLGWVGYQFYNLKIQPYDDIKATNNSSRLCRLCII